MHARRDVYLGIETIFFRNVATAGVVSPSDYRYGWSGSNDPSSTTASGASAKAHESEAPNPQILNPPASDTYQQFAAATGLSLPAVEKILFYESVAISDQLLKVIVDMARWDFTTWR